VSELLEMFGIAFAPKTEPCIRFGLYWPHKA
jgi:hypothetical protein